MWTSDEARQGPNRQPRSAIALERKNTNTSPASFADREVPMARKDEPSQLRHTGCITLKHLVLGALLLAVQCPLLCSAQAPTGNIEGIVTDASGAVIRHANITVTQKARGRVFTTTADADGHYAVSALEPADYVVQVEAPRFKTGLLKVRVDRKSTRLNSSH